MVNETVKGLLGGVCIVEMKDGGKFLFKVTEAANDHGREWIRGFDDEQLGLQIDLVDVFKIRDICGNVILEHQKRGEKNHGKRKNEHHEIRR